MASECSTSALIAEIVDLRRQVADYKAIIADMSQCPGRIGGRRCKRAISGYWRRAGWFPQLDTLAILSLTAD